MAKTEAQETATPEVDAVPANVNQNDRTENEILADILARTDFLEDVPRPESLPEGDGNEVDPDESESEDPMDEDESETDVDEESTEDEEESSEEDADEESATSDIQVLAEDEVDWDVQVPVTIDGETVNIPLSELRKGYATEQHLSKKGRELGDLRKEVEAERESKLKAVNELSEAMNAIFSNAEQQFAAEYHEIDKKIQEARDEGNTYEIPDLKDQREVAQQKYWQARQQRESLLKSVQEQQQAAEVEQWNQKVQTFYEGIAEYIPSYDDKYAESLREFGKAEGLSDEYMATITDPVVVKLLDDYRKLKTGVKTGAKKREKAVVKKAPTKKAKSATEKVVDKDNMIKARAFRKDASKDDQMAFLRNYASKSLSQL